MSLLTDLVSYWNFDSNLNDSLGNYNLTNNGTESVTGIINNGRDFVSADEDTMYNYDFNDTVYALSIWFKPKTQITAGGTTQRLIAFRTTATNQRFLNFGDSTILATDETLNILTGTSSDYGRTYIRDTISADWHHLVISWDSVNSKYKIYLDGVEKTTYAGSGSAGHAVLLDNTNCIGMGNIFGSSSSHLNMTIDEAGIWSRALTSSEVSELYNGGDGLAYPFEDKKIGPFPMHLRE